ncbi:pyridoxine synthesis protein PDX2 [Sphaerulina musiva SO2202]|uniref:glutaminase n=1 Tax=Sphaerulina musiva (strain SO2202) TaxID=692275 RepID=M3B016_SPHMS|nr:pyridoxine synthesis protein PDX2 [Sphaerulina musiva SO2202]EMF13132.1 pyridoxine synthesis protein PDX2 [Sphaerulina musiva SO2202]
MTSPPPTPQHLCIGVLALQGAFIEHITLLTQAAPSLTSQHNTTFTFLEVRTADQLSRCNALILPGGESTAISLIAERCGMLEPLRQFVKFHRRPTWGTCAGLILLAEEANKSKATGQELIGGLDVRVHRNYFGRQVESFEAALDLPFLKEEGNGKNDDEQPFHSVFIRAPVVESILKTPSEDDETEKEAVTVSAPQIKATSAPVEILGRLPGRARAIKNKTSTAEDLGEEGDIVAVRQGNVFGTSFHPELTGDERIHAWWLKEVIKSTFMQGT